MPSNIAFGAIRWDAWYSETGPATSTKSSLSQAKYNWRAPFFAQSDARGGVVFRATAQTMSQEIAFAKAGGISYWAFLLYDRAGTDQRMMDGFDLFQANPNKNDINWCEIRGTSLFGSTANHSAQVAECVSNMQQANYQKVLTNRPLLYIYWSSSQFTSNFGGSYPNFKAVLDEVRAGAVAAGLGDPYVVVMEGYPVGAETIRAAIGADAISNYISRTPDGRNKTYSSLDTSARSYWQELVDAAPASVPILMAGWNRRPRIERPVKWELSTQRPYFGLERTHADATNAELVAHAQAAVDFINANPTDCAARTAIWYAWNEFDEGGWLCPTLGDSSGSRLADLAPIMS